MENQVNVMPRIGEKAPSFEAVTTQGKINFPSDYAGKWIILFSHPADFTPVCTSEFMTFGKMSKEFEDLNCQLVGLSGLPDQRSARALALGRQRDVHLRRNGRGERPLAAVLHDL